ncbi:MAG: TusE/DsrC/DsvC family sulfur relay protein [Nitrospirae bacterium]|nr:TusE/DsrC/DsvC family sulfur relay protein [Nitrospirota bacterium]
MPVIEYSGARVNVDDEGYIVNFEDWNGDVACALAEKEGVEELTKEHIDILKFIREYYRAHHFFPVLNAICKNVHQPKNCVNEKFMDPLVAWKIAGLPAPDDLIINLLKYGQSPG